MAYSVLWRCGAMVAVDSSKGFMMALVRFGLAIVVRSDDPEARVAT